ncbi:universal stress protein [Natronobacterium gregoryi]|uniref:Universal stress protein n=2 Tax=Natronobacterium gregoryi TaxID=44930 RepID=L0AF87_NATGS|nr:universal stress protein [Natronobacterium gregoryi]AFZ71715.1 universal stress protein UspA-like protein [Natronobacterium gregoryi SP2]ELY72713.1 UspA domain-containing protein [Natronobacterium gregoryi SP2]PLK20237.1 universal stress protein [Natronobacterium gregoryi SP2]SFJ26483.1 Nucleotide-binding universal stress protein, UspA family [Natronobacterium gregoryi]
MAIDTILLAVGPMDTVRANGLAETVLETAKPLEASVVIGHAFTDHEYEEFRDDLGLEERVEHVDPDEVAENRPPVGDLVDRFEDAGVDYEIRGALGDVSDEVVDMARAVDADRIVLGGRRRSPAEKAVLGSVSQDILLQSPCPVTYYRDLDVME